MSNTITAPFQYRGDYTESAIQDYTGFASGEQFENEAQVREYFTPQAMTAMFGTDGLQDAETLKTMAEVVIENRWHCAF